MIFTLLIQKHCASITKFNVHLHAATNFGINLLFVNVDC